MNIQRPGLALCITFGIGFLVNIYGLLDAVLTIMLVFMGVAIYRLFLYRR